MLALFMFGIQLEQKMGSTEFLFYYFFSGIGAGLATGLLFEAMGLGGTYVLGASGAIFAVLLAFATFFPDARIFIFGILPMRAPTLVAVYAGIEIFSQLINPRSGVAHLAHLTGLAFGYLYLVVRFGMNPIEIFLKRR
jgi:membrane associated rhomboid family serine protease